MENYALGLIETKGLIGAIEATDAASKAAAVVVASAEVTEAAFVTIKIRGELSAVQASVEAGAYAAERVGELIAAHVIARPDNELIVMLPPKRYITKYHDDDRPPLSPDTEFTRPVKPCAPVSAAPVRRKPETKQSAPEQPRPPVAKAAKPLTVPKPKQPEQITRPMPRTSVPAPAAPEIKESTDLTTTPSFAELEKLSVVRLRQFARTISNLPIKGRQISRANKQQLLDEIRKVWNLE